MGLERRLLAGCIAALLYAWPAAEANSATGEAAVLLDFEDITCAREQAQCEVGEAYLSHGYALRYAPTLDEPSPGSLSAVGKRWRFNANGSTAMHINSCSGSVSLLANDNSAFNPISIDLAEMDGQGPTAVTFNAQREDGSTATFTAKLSGKPGWRRQPFPANFKRVIALSWSQGDCVSNRAHMFDRITLQPAAPARTGQ